MINKNEKEMLYPYEWIIQHTLRLKTGRKCAIVEENVFVFLLFVVDENV